MKSVDLGLRTFFVRFWFVFFWLVYPIFGNFVFFVAVLDFVTRDWYNISDSN